MSNIKLLKPNIKYNILKNQASIEECVVEIPYSRLYYDEIDGFIDKLKLMKELCLDVNDKIPVDSMNIDEAKNLEYKLHNLIKEYNTNEE